ncbi:MAG TPA: S8 family serine peptidase, partial [Bacteroidia bacterium]|nr:S8 family serine peptidase [Bacteroidia bacterium]
SQGCNEYTTDTQFGDQTINDNGQLEFVFSAGNNQGGNCNYGAGPGWGTITGGYKQGKNVIAVANLDALEVQDPSSSQGPASDGRIKPDIAANGRDQMSTDPNNGYQVGGGTSAACPGIAGITLQLTQAYKEINSATDAPTALLKASLLNSAEDIGVVGPDFRYGYGRVNAYRAVKVLEDNTYFNSTISQGGSNTHSITVPAGVKQVKVLLYWHDEGGNPAASTYLVNDLDMVVTDPASIGWFPWILDPTPNVVNLTTPAIRGADHLNNIEQFTYDNPAAGTYTVTISGFAVPQGPQEYYLVYEFRMDDVAVTYPGGGEGFVPGEQEVLRWDAVKGQGGFNIEYSIDNGSTWLNIANGFNQNSLQYTWTVPNTPTGEALVKVSTATATGTSFSTFSIIGVPQNFSVDWVCVDSIRLEWDPVAGAASYEVSMLGAAYMDSVGTTTTNSIILSGTSPTQDYWFSVRAVLPNGAKGRRALAIFRDGTGLLNCPLAVDVQTNAVLGPGTGTLQDCQNLAASSITMEIENRGQNAVTNVPVYYSLNGGTPVSGTYAGTIAPFATATYTFSSTVNLSVAGIYNIQTWTDYSGDLNSTNDTANATVTVIAGVTETLPFIENFDSYSTCNTASDCEATICNFGGGWINETNLAQDDIDFRINNAPTPSVNTGPDADHTSGAGNYAYTEASACFDKKVNLVSPCIDLTTATSPTLSFWYHMYGADMGELHVDLFANGTWVNDIIPAISGDQGNQWLQANTNLTAYVGGKVNIRFRGETGPNFTSDIAIDDINVYETSAPPVVNFNINNQSSCVGGIIQLTDLSNNNPTSWNWVFTPNTVTFVNGTSASSQNPQVQLNNGGSYDITLTATNGFGSNSLTQNAIVTATNATLPPVSEDFQVGFPPVGWSIVSSVGSPNWNPSVSITGSAGTPTIAAYFDNFNYNNPGSMDYLKTMEIDLTNALSAINTFDVAYARYSAAFSDTLIVAVSTDCGNTFTNAYVKGGVALATVADQTAIWQPASATEWRNDTVDLNAYLGQKIIVAFINLGYFGNSMYLDNINIDVTTSINSQSLASQLKVTPNPSTGLFKLDLSSVADKVEYNVTDISGRTVLSKKVKQGSTTEVIDLSMMSKGSYMLYLNTGNETKQVKLVVM